MCHKRCVPMCLVGSGTMAGVLWCCDQVCEFDVRCVCLFLFVVTCLLILAECCVCFSFVATFVSFLCFARSVSCHVHFVFFKIPTWDNCIAQSQFVCPRPWFVCISLVCVVFVVGQVWLVIVSSNSLCMLQLVVNTRDLEPWPPWRQWRRLWRRQQHLQHQPWRRRRWRPRRSEELSQHRWSPNQSKTSCETLSGLRMCKQAQPESVFLLCWQTIVQYSQCLSTLFAWCFPFNL